MKRLVFLVCIAGLMMACHKGGNDDAAAIKTAAPVEPSLQMMELNGPVKQIIEYTEQYEPLNVKQLNDYIVRKAAFAFRWIDPDIKGDSKFEYVSTYTVHYLSDDEDKVPYMQYRFDKDGYLTEEMGYHDEGNWAYQTLYTRNEDHRETKTEYFQGNEPKWRYINEYNAYGFSTHYTYWTADNGIGDPQESETLYTYDEQNNLICTEEYSNNSFDSKTVYTYDAYGNELEEVHSGNWSAKWTYTYLEGVEGKHDWLTGIRYFSPEDTLQDEYLFTYNEDFTEKQQVVRNAKGDTTAVYKYQLDDQARTTYEECIQYQPGGKKETTYKGYTEFDEHDNVVFASFTGLTPETNISTVYKFDDQNRQVEEVYCTNYEGPVQMRTVTTYGANGQPAVVDLYVGVLHPDCNVPEMIVSRQKYEYDEQGNWIRQEEYYFTNGQTADEEGHLTEVRTREIQYY